MRFQVPVQRRGVAHLPTLFMFATFSAALPAQVAVAPGGSAIDWRADLDHMVEQLRVRHPNPFHDISQADFIARASELSRRIGRLSDWQAAIELQRLLALVGEGHTGLGYIQPGFGARGYPIRFQSFADGVFVQAVHPDDERLIGARLLSIGNVPIAEVEQRISAVLSADNEPGRRRQLPFMLSVNLVLHGLGITRERDKAVYLLQRRDGIKERVSFDSEPVEQVGELLEPGIAIPANRAWVRMRDMESTPDPLWLRRSGDLYWLQYLPESRTLYAQINRLYDRGKFDFASFTKSLFESYDRDRPARVVVDLRHNTGGDHIDLPFVHEIIRRPDLNQRGRLFVLIGPSTFSAAQTFINHLEEHTEAIFVGEETSQRPNMYGVVDRFRLPSSGLRVSYSRYYIQGVDPADFRVATAPHIPVGYAAPDHIKGVDPALDAAIAFRASDVPGLLDEMRAAYETGGVDAAIAVYGRLRPIYSAQAVRTDPLLSWFAKGLLRRGKTDHAVQILRVNARAHPRSSNAQDALAEALLIAGRHAEASAAARAALSLNPGNEDARRVLRRAAAERGK